MTNNLANTQMLTNANHLALENWQRETEGQGDILKNKKKFLRGSFFFFFKWKTTLGNTFFDGASHTYVL